MAVRQRGSGGDVDTIILVDVDGVLNVGAADEGRTPILYNETNLMFAQRLWSQRTTHPERATIEKLIAISQKKLCRGEPEGQTMIKLAAGTESHISEVLVGRLAQILKACGPKSMVVLSSTWQAARHRGRLTELERLVSRFLGRDFRFDAGTGSLEDKTAEARLEAIGNFIAATTAPGGRAFAATADGSLRVLVLEDFFITPLSGDWSVRGMAMDSERAAERFLAQWLPSSAASSVKVIHTYDEWVSALVQSGKVRCGVGLSVHDVVRSMEFLGYSVCPEAVKACMSQSMSQSVSGTSESEFPGPAVGEYPSTEGLGFFGLSCFNSERPPSGRSAQGRRAPQAASPVSFEPL